MRFISLLIIIATVAGCNITGNIAREDAKEDSFDYKVYFCPETDCREEFSKLIRNASSAKCALYSVDAGILRKAIENNVSLQILTDSRSSLSSLNFSFVRKSSNSGLMHNKFCIFDNYTVFTGSFNPLNRGYRDNNNIVLISSKQLSKNYEEEFYELWNNLKDEKTRMPRINMGNIVVESYFCPEDVCAEKVESVLESANKSIYFMAYSFTHKGIANSLIIKKSEGIDVRGVIEKNNLRESVFDVLKQNNVDIKSDGNKALMHNKVFIVDEQLVITGSFNPTYSGDARNDENILILQSAEIAQLFLNEFESIWNNSG